MTFQTSPFQFGAFFSNFYTVLQVWKILSYFLCLFWLFPDIKKVQYRVKFAKWEFMAKSQPKETEVRIFDTGVSLTRIRLS